MLSNELWHHLNPASGKKGNTDLLCSWTCQHKAELSNCYGQRTTERLFPFNSFMCIAFQPHYIGLIICDLLSLYRLALCTYCLPWWFAVLTPFHTCHLRLGHRIVHHWPSSHLESSSVSTDAHRGLNVDGDLAWSKAWDHSFCLQKPGWGAPAGSMITELLS